MKSKTATPPKIRLARPPNLQPVNGAECAQEDAPKRPGNPSVMSESGRSIDVNGVKGSYLCSVAFHTSFHSPGILTFSKSDIDGAGSRKDCDISDTFMIQVMLTTDLSNLLPDECEGPQYDVKGHLIRAPAGASSPSTRQNALAIRPGRRPSPFGPSGRLRASLVSFLALCSSSLLLASGLVLVCPADSNFASRIAVEESMFATSHMLNQYVCKPLRTISEGAMAAPQNDCINIVVILGICMPSPDAAYRLGFAESIIRALFFASGLHVRGTAQSIASKFL